MGDPAASGPYVMFEIYRPGSAGEQFIDAPSEIAARIVAFTVTDDVKPAGQLDSKFGTVSLVDFAIAAGGPSGRQAEYFAKGHVPSRRCLGFVRPFEAPFMQLSGWYCSAGEEVVDRAVLACALDRLTLLTAGGDPALAMLFAKCRGETHLLRPAQPHPGGDTRAHRVSPTAAHSPGRQIQRLEAARLVADTLELSRAQTYFGPFTAVR